MKKSLIAMTLALAALALPTVALVNNAQREHLEFMATVEAVARENGQVLQALGAQGVAVFPSDDAWTPLWRELAAGRRLVQLGGMQQGLGRHAANPRAGSAQWATVD